MLLSTLVSGDQECTLPLWRVVQIRLRPAWADIQVSNFSPQNWLYRHPFTASGHWRPSQKIEFVFSASPETIRWSLWSLISVAQSASAGPGSLLAV